MQLIEQSSKQTDLGVIGRLAQSELRDLMSQRAQLNRRITVLRKTIRTLLGNGASRDSRTAAAVRLTPRKRDGLTHLCRQALREANDPITVRAVAELVRQYHPPEASRHRDLVASVGAVLRYLLESGEVNNAFDDEGNRTWFVVRSSPYS